MNIKATLKKNKFLQYLYPKFVKIKGAIRFRYMKATSDVLTEADLIRQFPMCGLKPGDMIVINSSMSKMGVLQDGPLTLINALKKYITPDGLIVMPSYPHRGAYDYLEHYQLFDVNTTPSQNGAITECFRQCKDVYRSAHPTHSLCAWGKEAENIMQGHELSKSPYDEYSPYKKLLDLDVKSFCIGVNFDHMIMIRVVDDLYKDYPIMPYIPGKIYKVPVRLANGNVVEVETPCHDPNYFSLERRNMKMFPYMKDKITFGHLGKAETWLLSSQEMFRIQVECAQKGVYAFNNYRFKSC